MMIPGGTEEQRSLAGRTATGGGGYASTALHQPPATASAGRHRSCCRRSTVPTLVVHSLGDRMNDFGQARHLAGEHRRGAVGRVGE